MPNTEFTDKLPAPVGLVCLIKELGLSVPIPAVRSEVVSGSRRTLARDGAVLEQYPRSYAPKGLIGQLKFAMRYEPIDVGVLSAIFKALDRKVVEGWIQSEPTSAYARRAWYLYELLMGQTLDVPDVPPTGYVDILNSDLHITGSIQRVRRQRVNDNLIGNVFYCPLIRRTQPLERFMASRLDKEARSLVEGVDPGVLARAVSYVYTKETKSSFAIEGEALGTDRSERFVAALANAARFNTSDAEEFVRLQNAIVDRRYAESGWRQVQNYVGQTKSDFTEHVHFVCPKPEDVPSLMDGWMQMVDRFHNSAADPVCAAAVASFGFVFIHPFEDGNGRIHRFLIHQMLARAGFTPEGLLFPVSAVMLRDRRKYDRVLYGYSSSIQPFVQYTLDPEGHMTVHNVTAHLHRFWDATAFAEYLYSCVQDAVRQDLRDEIGFLQIFDEAVRRTMDIVDMPDRRASLLVRLILQNKGKLSQTKRSQFSELTDTEIDAIEAGVRACASASSD